MKYSIYATRATRSSFEVLVCIFLLDLGLLPFIWASNLILSLCGQIQQFRGAMIKLFKWKAVAIRNIKDFEIKMIVV
jgi:hypothetical protein